MGKVIMSGIVPQLEAPSNFDPVFANNDWATIIETVQKNKVPDTWMVGDQKTMTINGTDYLIDIIGKNHDEYSDGSGTAPLTFQMHGCYGAVYNTEAVFLMNNSASNSGGWKSCVMRSTHLPAMLLKMPSEVQAGIRSVSKKSSAGSQSATIQTTDDKLFLLSEIEVVGSVYHSAAGEGVQYAYYAAGNSKRKYIKTSPVGWWLRSPAIEKNNAAFCYVTGDGGLMYGNANNENCVSFAFCF